MRTGREAQVSQALDLVAKRLKVPLTSVAIAYAMQKVSWLHRSRMYMCPVY